MFTIEYARNGWLLTNTTTSEKVVFKADELDASGPLGTEVADA